MSDEKPGEHAHPTRVNESARQGAAKPKTARIDKHNMQTTRAAAYEKILFKTL